MKRKIEKKETSLVGKRAGLKNNTPEGEREITKSEIMKFMESMNKPKPERRQIFHIYIESNLTFHIGEIESDPEADGWNGKWICYEELHHVYERAKQLGYNPCLVITLEDTTDRNIRTQSWWWITDKNEAITEFVIRTPDNEITDFLDVDKIRDRHKDIANAFFAFLSNFGINTGKYKGSWLDIADGAFR